MTEEEQKADFERNPKFERRLVVFYDVLGWRGVTESTEGIPERIGDLRRLVLLHSRILKLQAGGPAHVSTFSDNVVISAPIDEVVPNILKSVTLMQSMTQSRGLLVRGGVTVGDLYHDTECVFGPGLNRAYDLERKTAKYPRIILDPEVLKCGEMSSFVSIVDDVHFLDPFRREFLDDITKVWNVERDGKPVGTEDVWKIDHEVFVEVLTSPLADKEYKKIAWVVDRIAHHAGLKPASSYPRKGPRRGP